jgi:hypothetical protein
VAQALENRARLVGVDANSGNAPATTPQKARTHTANPRPGQGDEKRDRARLHWASSCSATSALAMVPSSAIGNRHPAAPLETPSTAPVTALKDRSPRTAAPELTAAA